MTVSMYFLTPGMFAVLALIPVLLLIHFLRSKPKQVEVANLFLWQEVLSERTQNLTLKRLKNNLPLILQILFVILSALALARPVWEHIVAKTGDIILILDTSASMKTRTASGATRFELAKQKALELLERRERRQRMLIIEAGREPAIPSGFLEDLAQAERLLNSLAPADVPGQLEQAVYAALSFIDPTRDATIYLITDGADRDFTALVKQYPKLVPLLISGGAKNIGITRFEFRQEVARPDQYEIMVAVKNFTADPIECPLQLTVDNSLITDTPITLNAREKRVLIFPYSGLLTGIAKATLAIEDDFPVDNAAYLALSPAKDLWVLFISPGNYFMEKLLEAYPNFLVTPITEIIPSSWAEQTRRHDVVIVDRMTVPEIEAGNVLLLDAYSPSIPIVKTGQVAAPDILDWDKQSPLMADVNLRGVMIEQASVLQADPSVQPIIESSQTGLMYTYQRDRLRAVILGFDLTKSDLPLKVAFPVMMSNIINWLNPYKLDVSALNAKAGDPFVIDLNGQTRAFSLRTPDGQWEEHAVTSPPFVYHNTSQVGIYTVLENKKSRYFTVNLADEAESDIQVPLLDLSTRTAATPLEAEQMTVQQPVWMLFLLLAAAIVMGEWYAWLKMR